MLAQRRGAGNIRSSVAGRCFCPAPDVPVQGWGTPRQKYEPPAFMRNGSIYLSKRNTIVNKNSIWGEHSVPMIMEEGSRISIDNMNDLRLVETILKKKNKA